MPHKGITDEHIHYIHLYTDKKIHLNTDKK